MAHYNELPEQAKCKHEQKLRDELELERLQEALVSFLQGYEHRQKLRDELELKKFKETLDAFSQK